MQGYLLLPYAGILYQKFWMQWHYCLHKGGVSTRIGGSVYFCRTNEVGWVWNLRWIYCLSLPVVLMGRGGHHSVCSAHSLVLLQLSQSILRRKCQLVRFIFIYLILRSYDLNMHVEGLLPANLCLVTLWTSGQCSQFERFHLQHV